MRILTPEQERDQAVVDARRANDDPAIQRALERLETGLVDMIASPPRQDSEGSWREMEAEACRTLRTVRALKRDLSMVLQRDRMELENQERLNELSRGGTSER